MDKKKVGIVTAFDVVGNYGNKLQNYAVAHIFRERGCSVDTIVVQKRRSAIVLTMACLVNRITKYRLDKRQLNWLKALGTRAFERKYLSLNFDLLKGEDISLKYDFFVLGSDQVWNPNWYNELKKQAFMLTFARPEQKKCIAPSFGISQLPEEWREWFKNNLQTFNSISVREDDGAKIIKELTGKDATVLIDPTLMLDADDWRRISEKPKNIDFDKPYVLSYFLGGKSEETKSDIKEICDNHGLVEYDLGVLNKHYPYASNPGQFLYLIEHATLVMTDSFHACAFSFLFSKPFLVYKRVGLDMSSRIETFLNKFHLQRKFAANEIETELFECNYEEGYVQLTSERNRFNEFIEESIFDEMN